MELEPRTKPGEWLEYSPLLTILVVGAAVRLSGRCLSARLRKAHSRRWI